MGVENLIKIPIFKGTNYANWKFCLTKFLELKERHRAITLDARPAAGVTEDEWRSMQTKVTNFLINIVADSQQQLIR